MSAVEIFVPHKPMGLNGRNGLIRAHFGARAKDKEAIELLLLPHLQALRAWGDQPGLKVLGFCIHTSRWMDWDNVGASFKNVGDALVNLGVLFDDSPKHLRAPLLDQKKVPRKDVGFTLTLYPNPDTSDDGAGTEEA